MNDTDDDLIQCLRTALATNPGRVQSVCHQGRFVWVKRRETLSPLRRLQKGDPAAAFEAERRALYQWRDLRAPAPEILAEGPDFIALADSGTPLSTLLHQAHADRLTAFAAAGQALADLHTRHISHGRPSLRDICWDGGRITFLDLERYSVARNTPRGHAMDLVMFVFNGLAVGRGMTPELQTAIDAYRGHDVGGIWQRARAWCRGKRWIDWATKPIQLRGEGKSLEFKAIPLTLDVFSAPCCDSGKT